MAERTILQFIIHVDNEYITIMFQAEEIKNAIKNVVYNMGGNSVSNPSGNSVFIYAFKKN